MGSGEKKEGSAGESKTGTAVNKRLPKLANENASFYPNDKSITSFAKEDEEEAEGRGEKKGKVKGWRLPSTVGNRSF